MNIGGWEASVIEGAWVSICNDTNDKEDVWVEPKVLQSLFEFWESIW